MNNYILAIFDCGCEYEPCYLDTVIVKWSTEKQANEIKRLLNIRSCYNQCSPKGYRELIEIRGDIKVEKIHIFSYQEFLEQWSFIYIKNIVYRYWNGKAVEYYRLHGKAPDYFDSIIMKYYMMGYGKT